MVDLWADKVLPMIQQGYEQTQGLDKIAQKAAAEARLAIFNDDWRDVLESRLLETYSTKAAKELLLMVDTSNNVFKRVVYLLATLYKDDPQRSITIPSGDPEIVAESIETPYDGFVDNPIMQILNEHFVLLNDVGTWIKWDAQKVDSKGNLGGCRMHPLNRSNCIVIPRNDFPSDVEAVVIELDNADKAITKKEPLFLYIDKEQTFLFNAKGDRFALPEVPDQTNPYGIIPIAWAHSGARVDMFWNPTRGNDLYEATVLTGVRHTLLDQALKWGAMKRLWVRLDPTVQDEPAAAMFHDASSVVKLKGAASGAGILDFQLDFKAMFDLTQSLIDSTLSTYGLSASMFTGRNAQAESGRALQIRNAGLKEARETQKKVFSKFEDDIFKIVRVVNNAHNTEQIPDVAEFAIDYAELDMFNDPDQEKNDLLWDLEHGIISPAQFYMHFNPDVTDEAEAELKIKENMSKTKDLKSNGFDLLAVFAGQPKQAFADDTNTPPALGQ